MSEPKGFARFRASKKSEPTFFEIEVGTLTVDARVNSIISGVMTKYGDKAKYGDAAVKTPSDAVKVLLEQFAWAKKKTAKKSKVEKESSPVATIPEKPVKAGK